MPDCWRCTALFCRRRRQQGQSPNANLRADRLLSDPFSSQTPALPLSHLQPRVSTRRRRTKGREEELGFRSESTVPMAMQVGMGLSRILLLIGAGNSPVSVLLAFLALFPIWNFWRFIRFWSLCCCFFRVYWLDRSEERAVVWYLGRTSGIVQVGYCCIRDFDPEISLIGGACGICTQGMVKGLEKSARESGGDSEIADALALQVI